MNGIQRQKEEVKLANIMEGKAGGGGGGGKNDNIQHSIFMQIFCVKGQRNKCPMAFPWLHC